MKTIIALILTTLTVATTAYTNNSEVTEKQPAPARRIVDLSLIKDKVHIKRGEEISAKFRLDGQLLIPRASGEKAQTSDLTIKIAVKDTTDTPFHVKGDPTRPYLLISNNTGEPIHFRVLTRNKGSKEFYEEDAFEPVKPLGEGHNTIVKCWESGSLVEEFVLFQLAQVLGESVKSSNER